MAQWQRGRWWHAASSLIVICVVFAAQVAAKVEQVHLALGVRWLSLGRWLMLLVKCSSNEVKSLLSKTFLFVSAGNRDNHARRVRR